MAIRVVHLAVAVTAAASLAACSRVLPTRTKDLLAAVSPAAVNTTSVLTQHNNNARTGVNLDEQVLTVANVSSHFGRLFALPVDDQIYAQPLYVAGVAIAGQGLRQVLYVATVNNSVYAFDADTPAAPLWQRNFNGTGAPVDRLDVGQACGDYKDFSGHIGIVGTPVIDEQKSTMYFVTRVTEGGQFRQELHAVAIASGRDQPGSPQTIAAAVPGSGDGHNEAGEITFNAQTANQRAALTLANGVVYIAWASHCDTGPYHGWILAYDAATLARVGVFNASTTLGQAGIWQSGGGLVVDDDGFIFAALGNGPSDGVHNFGESLLKLRPTQLDVVDYFTPWDHDALDRSDLDFGASGLLLVPGANVLVEGSKTGELFVMDKNHLGKMAAGDQQIKQRFSASGTPPVGGREDPAAPHVHGGPVFWQGPMGGVLYVMGQNDYMRAFPLRGDGTFDVTKVQRGVSNNSGMPGGMLSLSANAANPGTGILWVTHPSEGSANNATRPGILRALDASDVTKELWNSDGQRRDRLGAFAKFACPTVVNGKVYVPTFSNELVVYGLLEH